MWSVQKRWWVGGFKQLFNVHFLLVLLCFAVLLTILVLIIKPKKFKKPKIHTVNGITVLKFTL